MAPSPEYEVDQLEMRLRIPRNWSDFESLCLALWKEIWADPNAQRNGRQGQAQAGVDVYGIPLYTRSFAGVQCKDRDTHLGSQLTTKQLETECSNATLFTPALREFTVATTAPRDDTVQEHARKLLSEGRFPFDVYVWSWDDIVEEIRCRPKVLNAFYPEFQYNVSDNPELLTSLISHRDQFKAFFSRPELLRKLPHGLREDLLVLCNELSDNAFLHGRARTIRMTCEDHVIRIEDDGRAFNPLESLDATKAGVTSHIGSYVVRAFREVHRGRGTISYQRKTSGDRETNCLSIHFSEPTSMLEALPVEVLVDASGAMARRGAERLASTVDLPKAGGELRINVSDFHNISALFALILSLLRRLDPNARLIIYLPPHSMLNEAVRWFDDPRLTIIIR